MTVPTQAGRSNAGRGSLRGLAVGVILFSIGASAIQALEQRREAPDARQRIASTLVKWGVASKVQGFSAPAPAEEIARRQRMLTSEVGEDRVRAARWLAARGVERAGTAIAAAMQAPDTARPCQLAHSLGSLGDAQWVDELAASARQRINTDLRVCSVIAMRKMASASAVDVLLELTEDDVLRMQAIAALGEIGDARALPRLRQLRAAALDDAERRSIRRAITQIRTVNADDPGQALIERLRRSAEGGAVDGWVLRHLARLGEVRATPVIADICAASSLDSEDREACAAALLALGDAGARALRNLADAAEPAASAALSLTDSDAS